jgi:hypothetical protein
MYPHNPVLTKSLWTFFLVEDNREAAGNVQHSHQLFFSSRKINKY